MLVKRKFNLIPLMILLLGIIALPGTTLAHDDEKTNVFVPGDPTNVIKGAKAELEREDDLVALELETAVEPDHIITVWWIVFNNPAACSNPCGINDLPFLGGDPAVQAAGLWATGGVADDEGELELKAELEVGNPPGQILPWSAPGGLLDLKGAEIHIIVRTHGPEQEGLFHEQITTFGGGCNNTPPALGVPGTYECADIQAAIFLPGESDDD
jgi:hypothetical protein